MQHKYKYKDEVNIKNAHPYIYVHTHTDIHTRTSIKTFCTVCMYQIFIELAVRIILVLCISYILTTNSILEHGVTSTE